MPTPNQIQIRTGSRLHFGLIDTVSPFGGLGMMIDGPCTTITFNAADRFDAGSLADRALPIAQRVAKYRGLSDLPAVAIGIVERAPSHCGLGSGTQLSMAIAEGLIRMTGPPVGNIDLATRFADRGKRSAVGAHGYFCGGLIFELPDVSPDRLNPIHRHVELPSAWRIVLIRPRQTTAAVFGEAETKRFSELRPADSSRRDMLISIATREILPAVERADFHSFADGVGRYNTESGRLFESVQGGVFNGPVVTEVVHRLRRIGYGGCGQSSWGPAVFAWCATKAQANELAEQFSDDADETAVVKPLNYARKMQLD